MFVKHLSFRSEFQKYTIVGDCYVNLIIIELRLKSIARE